MGIKQELAQLFQETLTKAHLEVGLDQNCVVRELTRILPEHQDDFLQLATSYRARDSWVFTDGFMEHLRHKGFRVEEEEISPISEKADIFELDSRLGKEFDATLDALEKTSGLGGVLVRFTYDPENNLGHAEALTASDLARRPNGKRNRGQVDKLEQVLTASLVLPGAKRWKIWKED